MNYWLAPDGGVYSFKDAGCHCNIAISIIEKKFPEILDKFGIIPSDLDPIYFLERKGYIRYMGWYDKNSWIIYHQKPTNKQIRRMFDLTGFIYK